MAQFSGIEPRLVPLVNQALSPEAMLAAVTQHTKIVFVCNPNNPTGSWWNRAGLERFLTALDGRAWVVVDEAYREFLDDPDFPDGLEVMERHANVLVFRTFSKMYGLAGFRIGYLCGSLEAVDIVRRTHIAYSINSLGQLAATAALTDDAGHIAATRRMVDEAKGFLRDRFDAMGLEYISGAGNFIMVRTPISDTLLYRKLMREGVMVRTMTGFRYPNWIRVTLAQQPAMDAFAKALPKVLEHA